MTVGLVLNVTEEVFKMAQKDFQKRKSIVESEILSISKNLQDLKEVVAD